MKCDAAHFLAIDSRDGFMIPLRKNCDRTFFDPMTGKDETLIELLERMHPNYILVSCEEYHRTIMGWNNNDSSNRF